jgi:hypothetical protein
MKSACGQCRRTVALDAVYCAHCGAVHRLSPGHTALWLGQKAVIGAGIGIFIGAAAMGLLAVVLALAHGGLSDSMKTIRVLSGLGAICGGMLGAILKAVHAWNRRE